MSFLVPILSFIYPTKHVAEGTLKMRRSMYGSPNHTYTPNKATVDLPQEAYIKSRIPSMRSPQRSGSPVPLDNPASGIPYVTPSWVTDDMVGALNSLRRRNSQTDSEGSPSPSMGNQMLPKPKRPTPPRKSSTTSSYKFPPSESPVSQLRSVTPERAPTPPRTSVNVISSPRITATTTSRASPVPKPKRLDDSPAPAPRPKPAHLDSSPRASPILRSQTRLEDSPSPRPKPARLESSPRINSSPRSKPRLEDSPTSAPAPAPRPKPAYLEGSPRGSPQLRPKATRVEDSPIQAPLLDFPSSLLLDEQPKLPASLTRVDSDIRNSIPPVTMHEGIPTSILSGGDEDLRINGRGRSRRNHGHTSGKPVLHPRFATDVFPPFAPQPAKAATTDAVASSSSNGALFSESPPTPIILDAATPEITPSNSYFRRMNSIPQVTEENGMGLGLTNEKEPEVKRVSEVLFESPKMIRLGELVAALEEKQTTPGDISIASPVEEPQFSRRFSDSASSATAVDDSTSIKDNSVLKVEPDTDRTVEVVEVKSSAQEQDISEAKVHVEERAVLSPMVSSFEDGEKKEKEVKTQGHFVEVVSSAMDQVVELDKVAGIPSEDSLPSPVKKESLARVPVAAEEPPAPVITKTEQGTQTDLPPARILLSTPSSPIPQPLPTLPQLTDADLRQAAQDSVNNFIEILQPEIASIVDIQNKIALASLDGPDGAVEVMKGVIETMDKVRNLLQIMGAHSNVATEGEEKRQ
ncbi:hypothetical protein FRC03_000568 [Tulasnella sp. 419]|nr:hypothetical protein FRC03_000568 [Tulasnella sp. 419]